jgi:hypothetical protein
MRPPVVHVKTSLHKERAVVLQLRERVRAALAQDKNGRVYDLLSWEMSRELFNSRLRDAVKKSLKKARRSEFSETSTCRMPWNLTKGSCPFSLPGRT